jgi:YD repeat-containing protein
VVASTLGSLDLTTTRNGSYLLELLVKKGSDYINDVVQFALDSDLKLGEFTFTEEDLVIPVYGLPITIARTYSSLNPNSGDFGYGWTFAINDVEMEIAEERATVTSEEGEQFSMRQDDNLYRDVTLTLPGGRRTTFTFDTRPSGSLGNRRGFFIAPPGVTATLKPADASGQGGLDIDLLEAPLGRLAHWAGGDGGTPPYYYDFPGFLLKLQDGTEFWIERAALTAEPQHILLEDGSSFPVQPYGKGRVRRIEQPTGDIITIDPPVDGQFAISYYSPQTATTKAKVVCKLDTAGRIYEVYDALGLNPNGTPGSTPAVKYSYYTTGYQTGNLKKVERLVDRQTPTYQVTEYFYESPDLPRYLTKITRTQGARTIELIRNEYYSTTDPNAGRLWKTKDAYGNTTRFSYHLANQKQTIRNPLESDTAPGITYLFDQRGNITETVNQLGHRTRRQYDDQGYLLSETDPLGNTTRYIRDATGNPLTITQPFTIGNSADFTTTFSYSAQGDVASIKFPSQATQLYEYEAPGLPKHIQIGANSTIHAGAWTYANGRLLTDDGPFDVDTLEYSPGDDQVTLTDPLGVQTLSNFDPNGQLTSMTIAGSPSSFTYDALGRETSASYDDDQTSVDYNYDPGSPLDWNTASGPTIAPASTPLTRQFDDNARLQAWKLSNGATPGFAYDDAGRLQFETNSLGQITKYSYDDAGRLISTLNLATGAAVFDEWDEAGRLCSHTDADRRPDQDHQ